MLFPGLSDPFVQLCLEPQHIFTLVEPRCTQIKSCDLNPLFDEAFELYVLSFHSHKLNCTAIQVFLTSIL